MLSRWPMAVGTATKPSEAVAIGKELEALERGAAAKRKESTQGNRQTGEEKFSAPEKGKAIDKVAAAVGMSGPTYRKAKADPVNYVPANCRNKGRERLLTRCGHERVVKVTPSPARTRSKGVWRARHGVGDRGSVCWGASGWPTPWWGRWWGVAGQPRW